MLSGEARGSFGEALTFRMRDGRAVVNAKQTRAPIDNSVPTTRRRFFFGFKQLAISTLRTDGDRGRWFDGGRGIYDTPENIIARIFGTNWPDEIRSDAHNDIINGVMNSVKNWTPVDVTRVIWNEPDEGFWARVPNSRGMRWVDIFAGDEFVDLDAWQVAVSVRFYFFQLIGFVGNIRAGLGFDPVANYVIHGLLRTPPVALAKAA